MYVGLVEILLWLFMVLNVDGGYHYNVSSNYDCVGRFGEPGICVKQKDCLNSKGCYADLCGYLNENEPVHNTSITVPVECCDDINVVLKSQPNNLHIPGMRTSTRICNMHRFHRNKGNKINSFIKNKYYSTTRIECQNFKCRSYTIAHMFPSQIAIQYEFPHAVSLGWKHIDGHYDWRCGGSLISDHFILTAAHCLHFKDSLHKSDEPTMIRLGDPPLKDVLIDSVIPHPEYKPPSVYNDIGLVKLKNKITYTDDIRPGCLWTNYALPTAVTLIGKGEVEGGRMPARLRKGGVDIFTTLQCKKKFPESRRLPQGINVFKQFCAGSETTNTDSCRGDSGSPIQAKDTEMYRFYHILGITSFGSETCGTSRGGVYTKIYAYLDWIESNVWPKTYREINLINARYA